jgi:ethanolamine kinase
MLKEELPWLVNDLSVFKSPVVFCHNDLLSANLIFDRKNEKAYFIDYEYGCPSFRGFDIANHFCEYAGFDCDWSKYPSKDYQLNWLKNYLEKFGSQEDPERVFEEIEHFSLAAHFFWAIWAFVNYFNQDSSRNKRYRFRLFILWNNEIEAIFCKETDAQ